MFWMQPTQNPGFSCVGISGIGCALYRLQDPDHECTDDPLTIQLESTCDPKATTNQQFTMSEINPGAPVDTSGSSMPASW